MNQIRQTAEVSRCGEVAGRCGDEMPSKNSNSKDTELRMDEFDLHSFDRVICTFSGGKDSLATLLRLLDLGVDKSKIVLVHHLIDGRGPGSNFMDWHITENYICKIAEHFDIPVRFSWRKGGFEREMNRKDQLTGNVLFEDWDDPTIIHELEACGKPNTRGKFPQVSANLSVRWCSAALSN